MVVFVTCLWLCSLHVCGCVHYMFVDVFRAFLWLCSLYVCGCVQCVFEVVFIVCLRLCSWHVYGYNSFECIDVCCCHCPRYVDSCSYLTIGVLRVAKHLGCFDSVWLGVLLLPSVSWGVFADQV